MYPRATWQNVESLFRHHRDGVSAIQRLADVWAGVYGVHPVVVSTAKVSREVWAVSRLCLLLDSMSRALRYGSLTTEELPKHTGLPVVVLRTQGRGALLDGRRRVNLWRRTQRVGGVVVLVLEVSP